jgi:hypothetical protein
MRSLRERAEELRARNRVLRSVPGSGYHDRDVDPLHGRLCAPHMRHRVGGMEPDAPPQPPIDEHLIAFYDTRDVVFIDEDAEKVRQAVDAYALGVRLKIEEALASGQGIPQIPGTDWAIMNRINPRLKAQTNGELRVWREDWNDVLHVLDASCLATSGAPYADDGQGP